MFTCLINILLDPPLVVERGMNEEMRDGGKVSTKVSEGQDTFIDQKDAPQKHKIKYAVTRFICHHFYCGPQRVGV